MEGGNLFTWGKSVDSDVPWLIGKVRPSERGEGRNEMHSALQVLGIGDAGLYCIASTL